MAEFPWQVWFDACTTRKGHNNEALASGLRRMASSGEPIPPELLVALADLIHPPSGHNAAVLKLRSPQGGSEADLERQVAMAADLRQRLARGDKPYLAEAEVAELYRCDEITVRRLRDAVQADLAEWRAMSDSQPDD